MRSALATRPQGDVGRRTRHEGPAAGTLAATAVWVWLLVADMHSRTPFSTPAFLGRALLSVDAKGMHVSALAGVIAFTIGHYAIWMLVGKVVVAVVKRAARAPSILVGLVLICFLLQFLFFGVTAILAQSRLGPAAWPDMLIGNALGWATLGWYVYRGHPELRRELVQAARDDP